MNNAKTIFLLLIVTAALAALNVLLSICGGSRVAIAEYKTLVDPAEIPLELVVTRREAGRIRLVKTDDWRLVEPYDASADGNTVAKALDALSQTPVEESISEHDLLRLGRTRGDYDLENPPLVVKAGESAAVSLGSRTPDGAGVYAAIEGVDSVFVVSTNVLAAVDLAAADFRRRALFQVLAGSVNAFDVKRASGSVLSFTRDGASWRVGDVQASDSKVNSFLASLTGALAASFVWPTGATNESGSVAASSLAAWGLDPESAITVTMKCLGGADVQISFGKNADEKTVYALAQAGKAVVTVDASLKDRALQDESLYVDTRIFPQALRSVDSFSVRRGALLVVLARAGDGWRLESPVSAPADSAAVEDVLQRILSLSQGDRREDGVQVSLSTNSPQAVVSSERIFVGRDETSFRSRNILNIDPAMVKRVVVNRADEEKPVSVVYDRVRRAWNVEAAGGAAEASVDEAAVAKLLAALNPLKALRVADLRVSPQVQAKYGLEKPFMTVSVDQESGNSFRRNILIGAKTKGGRFATVGSSDAVFVIPSKTLADFAGALLRRTK